MRQRREIRTYKAALESLSTAAKLGSVELIFVKAAASVREYTLSTVLSLDATCKLFFSVKLFS